MKTMKQLTLMITVALLLASCSSTPVSDEQSKRKELQEYKKQLNELEEKIQVLESELHDKDTEESLEIEVARLDSQRFEHFIDVTGRVEAEQDVNVSPETAGIIESVLVSEGQRVNKGQVLGRLKTDALERNLEELKIQYQLAKTNYQRQKNLWDQNIGSEMQYLQARTNKESLEKRMAGIEAQLGMAEIKAPVNGVLDILFQKKGEMGGPQTPFAKVLNIEKIKIYADVSETYLTKVKKGEKVKISFPALGRTREAYIGQVGNTIDPNNRTFRIRIDLDNPDNMIKPNLVSVIKIRDYLAENAIVIPSLFIKEDFNGEYTYIAENIQGTPRAKKVYIKSGLSNNNMTEVVEGLSAGMNVISEGHGQVVDGTPVMF